MQFWAPDDGRKNSLKHVQRLKEINKLWKGASYWLYFENILAMHGPMDVKCNIYCFSTATMVTRTTSLLRYTYIAYSALSFGVSPSLHFRLIISSTNQSKAFALYHGMGHLLQHYTYLSKDELCRTKPMTARASCTTFCTWLYDIIQPNQLPHSFAVPEVTWPPWWAVPLLGTLQWHDSSALCGQGMCRQKRE